MTSGLCLVDESYSDLVRDNPTTEIKVTKMTDDSRRRSMKLCSTLVALLTKLFEQTRGRFESYSVRFPLKRSCSWFSAKKRWTGCTSGAGKDLALSTVLACTTNPSVADADSLSVNHHVPRVSCSDFATRMFEN